VGWLDGRIPGHFLALRVVSIDRAASRAGNSFDLFDLGFALARTDAMKDEDCMFKTKQEDNAGIVTMAGKLVPSPMQIIYWPEVEYSENELNEHD
jgi:hypothetical protein